MNTIIRKLLLAIMMMVATSIYAQNNYKQVDNIPYAMSSDSYAKDRCKLDVYYPTDKKDCPVVVWFHGGGLTSGNKSIPEKLKQEGLVVVAVNYRLMPKVPIDSCLDDAAASLAWVYREIKKYGGDTHKLFVSGHSAGGYLTMMLGLDKKWLAKYGVDADSITGLIPFSGQAISHFAYRDMKGIGNLQPLVDEYAPLFYVRKEAASMILITGDRELELFGRYEENAYLWRMMKLVGHPNTQLYELDGFGHGPMGEPAFYIMKEWIKKILGEKSAY